jgi:hypothetical protein
MQAFDGRAKAAGFQLISIISTEIRTDKYEEAQDGVFQNTGKGGWITKSEAKPREIREKRRVEGVYLKSAPNLGDRKARMAFIMVAVI